MRRGSDDAADETPEAGVREVADELVRVVAGASVRGDLPDGFAQDLLGAPDDDGALAILLEASASSAAQGGAVLGRELLAELAEGLLVSADRVARSHAVVPLLDSLRRHPQLAAGLLARDDVLAALLGAPRRPRLDDAVVRLLETVAPLRDPAAVAAVVAHLARADVPLHRLGPGVTTVLVEAFDAVAGLAAGAGEWLPLDAGELAVLVRRLGEDPECARRLLQRAVEHGRARMLVAVVAVDPTRLDEALTRALEVVALLSPGPPTGTGPGGPAAPATVALMRLTALQVLLEERPHRVPHPVVASWPVDAGGARAPVGRLGGRDVEDLLASLDAHDLLVVPDQPLPPRA